MDKTPTPSPKRCHTIRNTNESYASPPIIAYTDPDSMRPTSQGKPLHPILSEPSDHRFRPLAFRNDRNVETAVGTPEDQLLVSPCAEEIADGPDQDEPADNHQAVG